MDSKFLDELKQIDLDINCISDENVQNGMRFLFNAVEVLVTELNKVKAENQDLKNEINRLKGEQGPPDIRAQTKKDKADHSSENERRNKASHPKFRKPKARKDSLKVDRTKACKLDKSTLPEDAIFKGYDPIVIQGMRISTDNVEYIREVYYSPSEGRRYIAPLPAGCAGGYSPELKAWVIALHHDSQMTQSAILRFMISNGILISAAKISRILTDDVFLFHEEKAQIVTAGLQSSRYQQTDDTGGREKGRNIYVHVLCNEWYSAYFTRKHKDRLTVLEILNNGPLNFVFNEISSDLIKEELPKKFWTELDTFCDVNQGALLNQEQVDQCLLKLFPNQTKHHKHRQLILEASALTAYSQREDAIKILLSDDAPQFKGLTEHLGLCWVHDGRHFKKLKPFWLGNQQKLRAFLSLYWDYYHKLLEFKKDPDESRAAVLEKEFDVLMSSKTGYQELDDRIAKTKAKKENLLLALKYPEIPLHNNASELAARRQARFRDISLHTMSRAGTEARDTMMTLGQTAAKLGVNFFHYLQDRLTQTLKMPSLASIILNRSRMS